MNTAMHLAEQGKKVTIVDLDIVNPYFRTNDARSVLEQRGIRVIAPEFANSNLDMPAVPQEVASVFCDRETTAVFDVGGDEDGAFALGQYKRFFDEEGYGMYMVVNAKRPMMAEDGTLFAMARMIEAASRLKFTGVINNTNLGKLSDTQTLCSGMEQAKKLAQELGVPIAAQSGLPEVLAGLPQEVEGRRLPMRIYIKMPWEI